MTYPLNTADFKLELQASYSFCDCNSIIKPSYYKSAIRTGEDKDNKGIWTNGIEKSMT